MSPDALPPTSPLTHESTWTPSDWGRAALIFATLLVVYAPALRGEFLWDDAAHVTKPELRSLTGLALIWKQLGATQQYYPVLHSAFWVEHRLWGDAPLGYHLVNLALHAAATVLLARLLRRLAVPGAWFAAAVFALHPVAVESVAWISEQKNTLSLVFYLAAALAYLRFDERRTFGRYAAASGLFALAVLSKSVTATLPAALLVLAWWQREKIAWRRDVMPLAPWLGFGAAAGLFTAWIERAIVGAEGTMFALTFLERWSLAGRAIWFYAGKLFWPTELTFIYPRWDLANITVGQLWLLPAVLAVAAALEWRRRRGALAGWLIFCGSLFPVLGFFNAYPFRFSFVADHFQYLASLGLIVPTAAGATLAFAAVPRWLRVTITMVTLGGLGALSWRQSTEYRDGITLYTATLAKNPACWLAENNLGAALRQRGDLAGAIVHLSRAVQLEPTLPEGHNNLGSALAMVGRLAEAETHYLLALDLRPAYAEAHYNLALTLRSAGRNAEARPHYETARRLNPRLPAISW